MTMKNKILIFFATAFLAAVSTGCSVNEEGIYGSFPYLEIETDSKNITKVASNEGITVRTNRSLTVTVDAAGASWLAASVEGDQVVLTWKENTLETTREAVVTVSTPNSLVTKEIKVIQDASGELTIQDDLILRSKTEIEKNTYTKTTGNLIIGNVTNVVTKAVSNSVSVDLGNKVYTASSSDISDADMEKGQMRCDVNVSLRPKGQKELGAKIEMKNINSMSAARRALIYEIHRQAEELDMGIAQVQSTRRWDDTLGESIVMRTKENAHDYRYHTCPDLIPVQTAPLVEKVKNELPELPDALHARLQSQYGLPVADANTLVGDFKLCRYFEEAAAGSKAPRKVANWVINNLTAVLAEKELAIETCPLAPAALAGLVDIIEDGLVSNNQAREVLEKMWESGMSAAAAADAMGFKKTDTNALDAVVAQVLEENPDMVAIVKGGNMKLINALTGKVMKVSNPKPNPKMVTEIILAKLGL